jgi:Ca2+/H+ antiporter, TMEM165/GDT1 family
LEALVAFAAAFGLVFLAELGDRTQLVLFALATRHPRLPLFLGAAAAFLVQTFLAVLVGDRLGVILPTPLVLLAGAALFLVMGAFALRAALRHEEEAVEAVPSRRGAFLTAFGFVLVAELGDKTQLAAAALAAASRAPVATFLGASLALLASAAFALALGRIVATRFNGRTVRFAAAAGFLLAGGALMIASVL